MPGFMDTYGAGEERTIRRAKTAVFTVVAILLLAVAGYLFGRNWKNRQTLDAFFEHVGRKDYVGAHAIWGCSPQTPCRDYNMERFLRDWGPESDFAKAGAARKQTSWNCEGGYMRQYRIGQEDVRLFVNDGDRAMSFAPQPRARQCSILW